MKNIYENMYENKEKLDLNNNPRIKRMLKMIDGLKLENKNVLDIGCYDGTFLSSINNRSNHFYGLEANKYGAAESVTKGIEVCQFYFDDRARIPFEDRMFDVVITGEIIEHIYDTDFFLTEVSRLLNSTGKLLISTPNIASLGRRLILLLGKNPIIEISPNENDSSGHIRYFTFDTLNLLLKKNGFKLENWRSDIVNFSRDGKLHSQTLAQLFPTLGQSIIGLYAKQ